MQSPDRDWQPVAADFRGSRGEEAGAEGREYALTVRQQQELAMAGEPAIAGHSGWAVVVTRSLDNRPHGHKRHACRRRNACARSPDRGNSPEMRGYVQEVLHGRWVLMQCPQTSVPAAVVPAAG